jgi:hypothetical protein
MWSLAFVNSDFHRSAALWSEVPFQVESQQRLPCSFDFPANGARRRRVVQWGKEKTPP